jgi:hypothetical protein
LALGLSLKALLDFFSIQITKKKHDPEVDLLTMRDKKLFRISMRFRRDLKTVFEQQK